MPIPSVRCCLWLVLGFCVAITPAGAEPPAPRKVAVIPKGTTHVFWKSIEAGARQAGQDLGVEIVWKGPLKENDRAQQIAIVEQFTGEGLAGMVLAPLDQAALVRPVRAAAARGLPVVIIDSALQAEAGRDYISFVATDNRKGGELGGRELVRLLDGKGRVVLLRYMVGSASTMERESGFLDAINGAGERMTVLSDNRHAGATAGEARTASMNMADQLRQADGIFCPNESSTFGMLLTLRQLNLAGKVRFVGFDTSPPLVEALEKGEIDALVAQDPTRMGYLGVQTLVAHLDGRPVAATIDTGARLITRANLATPEVRALLGRP